MVTQRQIVAILTVAGTVVGLGFAIYNLWIAFQPNYSLTKREAEAKAR